MANHVPTNLPGDLPAPARRALANHGIKSLEQLAFFSDAEILKLHGIGKNALSKLKEAMAQKHLMFRK